MGVGRGRLGQRRGGVRLARLLLGGLGIGGGVRLRFFQFLDGAHQHFDLGLQRLDLRFGRRLRIGLAACTQN